MLLSSIRRVHCQRAGRFFSASPDRTHSIPPWFNVEADEPDLVNNSLRTKHTRPRQNRCHMSYKDQVAALAHHLGEDLGSVASEARPLALTVEQMYDLLTTQDYQLEAALYDYANAVTELYFGDRVSFRGLVEFSNVCVKDCGYCGIRKHHQTERYTMEKQEVVDVALWAFDHGYGSLMLQSGELPTEKRLEWTVNVIKEIKEKTKAKEIEKGLSPEEARGMGIAIGLGELPKDWYQELYDAGAHRYLLRIESSNPNLYSRLHPADGNHSWHKRVQALHDLRDIGYQLGTGVMVGLPGQTFRDLAGDLQFFRDIEADMIGTGPYIFADGTPVGDVWRQMNPEGTFNQKQYYSELLEVTCRFLSLARITLADVNISATTALQVLDPIGREIALGRGANQMMPILTATTYRKNYQLYAGKPCVDEGHEDCRACLTNRVKFVGKSLHLNDWADPPSYFRRRGLPYNAPTNIPESPCIRECKSCTELEH